MADDALQRDPAEPVRFDTKLAVILDESLAVWQKANVTAFLISGLAATDPSLVGDPYKTRRATSTRRCAGSRFSSSADAAGIRRAYERAMTRGVERLAIFTHELFATSHDAANRAAVAAVQADDLALAGIALHADRRTVDKVVDRLRPHP